MPRAARDASPDGPDQHRLRLRPWNAHRSVLHRARLERAPPFHSGRVLEVKDTTYTDTFGTAVAQRDILDVDPLTQTLRYIYEMRAALRHARRILKPGGALLATMPAVSPILEDDALTDYWRFTPASCTELFGDIFGRDSIRVRAYRNVLTAIGFLASFEYEELTTEELETQDARFSILVSVHAVKK